MPRCNPSLSNRSLCSYSVHVCKIVIYFLFLGFLFAVVSTQQEGGDQRQCPSPGSITAGGCRVGCILRPDRMSEQRCPSCNQTCNSTHIVEIHVVCAIAVGLHACITRPIHPLLFCTIKHMRVL